MTRLRVLTILGLTCLSWNLSSALSLEGSKCGQQYCPMHEYCSPYDSQCRPCTDICDKSTHNHEMEDCIKYCQDYLHDQRYVLRADMGSYEDLKGEVQRLRTLFTITLTLTCFTMLAIICLLGKAFVRWNKISSTLQRVFTKKWMKKATNNNKVHDDVEAGPKQNGLKLTMPTISGVVSGTQSTGNSNSTPNTTSTPLSRRHPSEDTTLDYAYDNPAMTPSPEAAQLRIKHESSF